MTDWRCIAECTDQEWFFDLKYEKTHLMKKDRKAMPREQKFVMKDNEQRMGWPKRERMQLVDKWRPIEP